MMIVQLTDQDLVAKMKNFEDHFVERKVAKDDKDWLKTAVAFANSAPVGFPCVLYIGVRDSGEIETPQVNLDEIQKKFNTKLQKAFPAIPYLPQIITDQGRQALAVIVLGSELRPHFAGPSYVRLGSESLVASDQQFAELIASRNSKAHMILSFKGKQVKVINRKHHSHGADETHWNVNPTVTFCNQWWVTVQQPAGAFFTFPLDEVTLSFETSIGTLLLYVQR
jgi:predicted HTH transcriptional regulator